MKHISFHDLVSSHPHAIAIYGQGLAMTKAASAGLKELRVLDLAGGGGVVGRVLSELAPGAHYVNLDWSPSELAKSGGARVLGQRSELPFRKNSST